MFGQDIIDRFFRREPKSEEIQAGSTYRRYLADRTVETAEVLTIKDDAFGIPHVRFDVKIGRASDNCLAHDGTRILSLETFAEQFVEKIASHVVAKPVTADAA
jgi:hypothetical protein